MASRLQDVILRGLSVDKPLATSVAPGTLYYSSDLTIIERSDGAIWDSYSGGMVSTPTTPIEGQWWVEVTGVSPARIAALKVFDGGVTRTIASITY